MKDGFNGVAEGGVTAPRWTVIRRTTASGIAFDDLEADSLEFEVDAPKGESPRGYYVFRDPTGEEVARFRVDEVEGIRRE